MSITRKMQLDQIERSMADLTNLKARLVAEQVLVDAEVYKQQMRMLKDTEVYKQRMAVLEDAEVYKLIVGLVQALDDASQKRS